MYHQAQKLHRSPVQIRKTYEDATDGIASLGHFLRLDVVDWGLPKVIISDRDRKFLSDFWTAIFDKLSVSLLYPTAYHPQTDGTSERTNQTAEIALRFYVHGLDKCFKWLEVFLRIQAFLNNSSASGLTLNEVE